jgi:hypothetical protein
MPGRAEQRIRSKDDAEAVPIATLSRPGAGYKMQVYEHASILFVGAMAVAGVAALGAFP